MRARDIMQTDLVTIDEQASVGLALQLMLWNGLRHLPVMRGDELVGVLSERDLRRARLSSDAPPSVGSLMSSPAVTATPDTDLSDCAACLVSEHVGALPILDDGALVGILTTTDLVASIARPAERVRDTARTVASIMTHRVITTSPDEPLLEAGARMAERGVRHLPVVDGDGCAVGMLSDRDVRTLLGDPLWERWGPGAGGRIEGLKVRDAMTRPVCSVPVEATIAEVQEMLADTRFGAMPIIDAEARVVGIVSYVDLLRALEDGPPTVRTVRTGETAHGLR